MAFHTQEPAYLQNLDVQKDDPPEPTNLFSLLRLNNGNHSPCSSSGVATGGCAHLVHHSPCTACGCQGFNSMKRRSPEAELEPSPAKKPSCEQEDQTQLRGFSAVPLPISLETLPTIHNKRSTQPVFRRCVSDPYTPPSAVGAGAPMTLNPSPENTPLASRLPPRPRPSLKRCVSDPTYSSGNTIFLDSSLGDNPGMGVDLDKEENSNSMRLRRMKNRLREMKNWCDEIMQEEEEEEEEDHVVEGDKAVSIPKDECGGEDGPEEVVSVEWVEKSLCINFKCPCGKGYQILLSGNKCFYKLV